jgi:hypothetical protein
MSFSLGDTLAGLLNASFGNAVEIIVGIAALIQGMVNLPSILTFISEASIRRNPHRPNLCTSFLSVSGSTDPLNRCSDQSCRTFCSFLDVPLLPVCPYCDILLYARLITFFVRWLVQTGMQFSDHCCTGVCKTLFWIPLIDLFPGRARYGYNSLLERPLLTLLSG